jgi:hypothetical protein
MASTYVNDLRLNEMATGDASGSWGTVTNTNLELIGEAFSYGTETIGDADSTLTIADGAADAARSFYLKITSSVDLTTTRIVTLGPNTVSKVWMIENATTGSQVITIKQGSGATINVPNGQVKMISTDGAGSGGAVLDLLVDVDLTGTTTLVNLDVSGTALVTGVLTTTAATVFNGGFTANADSTLGTDKKVQFRDAAIYINSSVDGQLDIVADTEIQIAATTVDLNGNLDVSGTALVTGVLTTTAATVSNGGGQFNGAINVGVDDTGYDVKFFGATAGAYMLWDESADDLILGGAGGLVVAGNVDFNGDLDVDGTTNLDVVDIDGAVNLGSTFTFGDAAYIIGNSTNGIRINKSDDSVNLFKFLDDGSFQTVTLGTSNLRLGLNAGNSILSGGNYNTVVGDEAGTAITTGDLMTAVGYRALFTEDTGERSTAVGAYTLTAQNSAVENYNTAVGYAAGNAVTTGVNNTLIGGQAGDALTDADGNVALGYAALGVDTLGSTSTAIGLGSLANQNFTTATDSYNVAVGYHSGLNVTTGTNNTLIGAAAGDLLTDADNNVAVGTGALGSDTLGNLSVAIGKDALGVQNFVSATNSNNTAVGYIAGGAITTGIQNTLIGSSAGDSLSDADFNVAVGFNALGGDTLGSRSTAIGYGALLAQNFVSATNADNTAVGYDSLGSASTGQTNTATGKSSLNSLTTGSNNVAVGHESGAQGAMINIIGEDNRAIFGNNATTNAYVKVAWTVTSDARDKTNINPIPHGLDFVQQLNPVSYNFKKSREDDTPHGGKRYGFLAQDILALEGDDNVIIDNEYADNLKYQGESLVPVLVKAIKELSAKNDALEVRLAALEG